MPRAKVFTFDSAALAVDEAFSAALADPAQREALVDEAIDSMHGLSQPWASRMTRLIRVLHGGPDYVDFVPTPKIRKKRPR